MLPYRYYIIKLNSILSNLNINIDTYNLTIIKFIRKIIHFQIYEQYLEISRLMFTDNIKTIKIK